jgi:hypothetical protein
MITSFGPVVRVVHPGIWGDLGYAVQVWDDQLKTWWAQSFHEDQLSAFGTARHCRMLVLEGEDVPDEL